MQIDTLLNRSVRAWQVTSPDRRRKNDDRVPDEKFQTALTRRLLTCIWGLKPPQLQTLPSLAGMLARHYLTPASDRRLPDPERTAPGREGLCGILHDTSADTLLAGMRQGMFALGHVSPMKWWSPPQRCVVFPHELKIEKNLHRLMRKHPFRITFDQDPLGVMQGCAAPRPGRPPLTWLTPDMMRLALDAFDAGFMHSVEVWDEDGELVGGLYGFAVGRVFTIESQFHTRRNTSKIATVALLAHLTDWGFAAADGKQPTQHLTNFGFHCIPRDEFRQLVDGPDAGPARRWQFDPELEIGQWKPAEGPPERKSAEKSGKKKLKPVTHR